MESEQVDFVATRQCVCTAARRRSRDLTRAFEKAMRGSGVRGAQFTLWRLDASSLGSAEAPGVERMSVDCY
jgi:hypothetical protein